MIISKAPMRFSICGGGSDLPNFLATEGFGQTLTTTLNKYVYVAVHESSNENHRLVYSEIETIKNVDEINHKILMQLFKYVEIHKKIELFSIADLPAKGTGLGASSAFCLAAVAALSEFEGKNFDNLTYAKMASYVEMEMAGSSAGYQDQYASATGGVTLLDFGSTGLTQARPISDETGNLIDWMNQHFVFVRSPGDRDSSKILNEIIFSETTIRNAQVRIRDLVSSAVKAIQLRDLRELGTVMNENWDLKKSLTGAISNEKVDQLYAEGLANGALGGKLLGAGGSGYVVFVVESKEDFLNKMALVDSGIRITGDKLEVKVV